MTGPHDQKSIGFFDTSRINPAVFAIMALLVLSVSSVIFENFYPFLIIPVMAVAALSFFDLRWLYALLFFLIPLSTEMDLPGGVNLDFPDEVLMLSIYLIALLWFAHHLFQLDLTWFYHPVSLLLLIHFLWIFIAAINAEIPLYGIKFFLSKSWYIIVFFALPFFVFKSTVNYKIIFHAFFISLGIVVLIVTVRHWIEQDFSFAGVNYVMGPFFRNHVTYGSILAVSFPFVVWLWRISRKGSFASVWLSFLLILIPAGVYLSFTRAAIGAMVLAIGFAFILQWRLIKPTIIIALTGAVIFVGTIVTENRYLIFAPQYEKTITHTDFDNLIDATVKLEDISTMERVYRWVAGFHMLAEKPLLGFGPSNFYSSYKSYTINKFRTYVSDNPEQSGMHNYFLMTAVEQGIPGLVFFIALVVIVFVYAEKVLHMCDEKKDRFLIFAASTCLFIIMVLQTMNDLIETDKVGPFFFISICIIVQMHIKYMRKRKSEIHQNITETEP